MGAGVQRSIWHVHEHCTSIVLIFLLCVGGLGRTGVCTAIYWVCKLGQAVIIDVLQWPYSMIYPWCFSQAEAMPSTSRRVLWRLESFSTPSGCFPFWFRSISSAVISALILINVALFLIKAGLILSRAALEHTVPELRGRFSLDATSAGGSCTKYLVLNDHAILRKLWSFHLGIS